MATTVTIPSTTITGVAKTFTAPVPTGLTGFTVSLDVATLDAATPIASRQQLYMEVDASYDNGTTWNQIASKFQPGGSVPADGGTFTTVAYMSVSIGGNPASTLRQVRGLVKTTLSNGVTAGSSFTSSGGSIVAQ
jgi:hypothetical protein